MPNDRELGLDVRNKLPLGAPVAGLWRNVAGDLSKVSIKESATEFLSSVAAEEVKTAKAFQATMRGLRGQDLQ